MNLKITFGPVADERLPDGAHFVVYSMPDRKGVHTNRYFLLHDINIIDLDSKLTLTIPATDDTDGVTGWFDDNRLWVAWMGHDWCCKYAQWDDGTPIGALTAARVIWELIGFCGRMYKKKWFGGRAFAYSIATYIGGCFKAKQIGWFK